MSDRVQDLTNHRKVAVACKNYTDKEVKKAKDELMTFFSRNTVETDDHTNELAYQITAPSGAKLLQLQAIGGNTVKLSPSVASDSTKAMIKTMPSTIYTFDGSKFYGASEVSENLIVLSDIAERTLNGITYKRENGVIYISGTASNTTTISIDTSLTINAGDYYFKMFNWSTGLGIDYNFINNAYGYEFYNTSSGSSLINTKTFANNDLLRRLDIVIANGTAISGTLQLKPMLVKGTTAPTEFKVGYTGIHNLELSGLKVEGFNIWDQQWENGRYDNTTGQPDVSALNVRSKNNIPVKGNTTYYCRAGGSGYSVWLLFYDSEHNLIITTNSVVGARNQDRNNFEVQNHTFTTPYNCAFVKFYCTKRYGATYKNDICINISGSANGTYVPYVAPTTKTIDLTTIVDSNNNKLFPNGKLMGYNNLKDVLGVYNQESKWAEVVLNGTENNWNMYNTGQFSIALNPAPKSNTPNFKWSPTDIWQNTNLGVRPSISIESNLLVFRTTAYDGGSGIDNITDWKAYLQANPITIQYERATYLTSNTDLSATLRNIQGYPNGSIIAENTNNMDVESVITYNSIIQETLCPSVTVDGFNVWDEQWEVGAIDSNGQPFTSTVSLRSKNYCSCIGNTTYYFKHPTIRSGYYAYFYWYDSNQNYITRIAGDNNFTATSPINANYFKIVIEYYIADYTTYKNDICINISNQDLNGTYKPYKAPITRNLPTQASDGYSAGNQRNYRVFCDDEGNEVLKRETNVSKNSNMGASTYTYDGTYGVFYTEVSDKKIGLTNILTDKYTTSSANVWTDLNNMEIIGKDNNSYIFMKNTLYSQPSIFKTSMTNEPLYYELADTSKTETDMDDFDYFFDVEEGDVITFNNPYAQQVYATYSFLIKEAKSNE